MSSFRRSFGLTGLQAIHWLHYSTRQSHLYSLGNETMYIL